MLRLTFESSLKGFAGGWLAFWGLKLTSELTIFLSLQMKITEGVVSGKLHVTIRF